MGVRACGQGSILSIFLYYSPPSFLRQSLNKLGVSLPVKQAVQQAQGIYLSLCPPSPSPGVQDVCIFTPGFLPGC